MVRIIEQCLLRNPEMDQVPQSRERNDSEITEISQIRNEIEIIGNTESAF